MPRQKREQAGKPAARRPAKRPLSVARIEDTALALIERDGLAAFSTRRLAAALGCEAMSIYHYFPSKAYLMDALVDRVVAEIPPIPPPPLTFEERLRRHATDWRRVMAARPNLFVYLATHRMNTRAGLTWLDAVLGLFAEAGLTHEEGVRIFRAFGYFLMGAGLDETAGYARGPSTVAPVPPEELQAAFPHVAAAGRYFRPEEYDRTFEVGLDLLLEGVRAAIGRRRAEKSGAASTTE